MPFADQRSISCVIGLKAIKAYVFIWPSLILFYCEASLRVMYTNLNTAKIMSLMKEALLFEISQFALVYPLHKQIEKLKLVFKYKHS